MWYNVKPEAVLFQPQLAISEGVSSADMLSLQLYLGVAFCVGSAAVGAVVVNNSTECRIARQYLCQAALAVCALSIYALAAIRKERGGGETPKYSGGQFN